MKLRKHHLHSHGGASGASGATASSSTIKCTSSGSSSSARTQLKFLDKHSSPSAEEGAVGSVQDAQDQQWLIDNITTLKKMKQLRQSLEAKKKKKPRSCNDASQGYYDDFSQDLKDVQMDLEIHEKLQRWLHRVASNATHLSDADTVVPHAQFVAGSGSSGSSVNLFSERVRRKSSSSSGHMEQLGGSPAGLGSSLSMGHSNSAISGGVRKKESQTAYPSSSSGGGGGGGGGGATTMMSSYPMPVEEYCLMAKDATRSGTGTKSKLSNSVGTSAGGAEDRFTASRIQQLEDGGDDLGSSMRREQEERQKKRRESSQFEERLLTQFYDYSSPQCENLFRAYATGGQKEGGSCGGGGGGRNSLAMGGMSRGGEPSTSGGGVSKFRWRFHNEPTKQKQLDDESEADGASEEFLNAVLRKNRPARDYRRWTDAVEEHREEKERATPEEPQVEEVSTVIIEKADEGEEEALLGAVCSDILNDPDAFEDEGDEEQLAEVEDKRFELMNLMGLESSSSDLDSDSGGEFSLLKNQGYFDLEEEDEEDEEDEDDVPCLVDVKSEASDDDPVLLYENEEDGAATFLGVGKKDFWPNFDKEEDEKDHDADEENEEAEEAKG